MRLHWFNTTPYESYTGPLAAFGTVPMRKTRMNTPAARPRQTNGMQLYGRPYTLHTLRKDFLAGIVTALVGVPLSIGIAIVSGYPIQVGLFTVVCACMIGFVCSLFRPGNYNGVAGISAGLAPMLALGVHTFGMTNMPTIVFLTAVIQIFIWRFRLERFVMRIVPHYLVEGLLAGVGLTIVAKFLPYTTHVSHSTTPWSSVLIGALSLITLAVFWLTYKQFEHTHPGVPYMAVVATGIVVAIMLTVPMVHIDTTHMLLRLPLPDAAHLSLTTVLSMITFSAALAIIDVIEQVMSNVAIGKIDPYKRRVNTNNSLFAIWIANLSSSFFGGMTNLDGLAKSSTNIYAGAVTKVSNVFTGLTILVFALHPQILERIPMYVLAVLMLFTASRMVLGLRSVTREGRYAMALALFCCILVWRIGIFESIIITMAVHAVVRYMTHRRYNKNTRTIFRHFVNRLSQDAPGALAD